MILVVLKRGPWPYTENPHADGLSSGGAQSSCRNLQEAQRPSEDNDAKDELLKVQKSWGVVGGGGVKGRL